MFKFIFKYNQNFMFKGSYAKDRIDVMWKTSFS